MRELDDQLSGKEVWCEENWLYIPHLTILKTELDEQARAACVVARERWAQFSGKRQVHVDELMFVRENGGCWGGVGPPPFGGGPFAAGVVAGTESRTNPQTIPQKTPENPTPEAGCADR